MLAWNYLYLLKFFYNCFFLLLLFCFVLFLVAFSAKPTSTREGDDEREHLNGHSPGQDRLHIFLAKL